MGFGESFGVMGLKLGVWVLGSRVLGLGRWFGLSVMGLGLED